MYCCSYVLNCEKILIMQAIAANILPKNESLHQKFKSLSSYVSQSLSDIPKLDIVGSISHCIPMNIHSIPMFHG